MPTIRCLTEDLGLALPWLDTDLGDLEDPWLGELRRIAVHRRQEGSDDDAYTWFAKLHADGKLLPSGDDRLRDAPRRSSGCSGA
jgi:hypothetical protein